METEISNALSILIIGMLTVFFILWLVVLIGNGIILLVNKFDPEDEKKAETKGFKSPKQNALAAIVATVDIVTKGKGKIIDITQIK